MKKKFLTLMAILNCTVALNLCAASEKPAPSEVDPKERIQNLDTLEKKASAISAVFTPFAYGAMITATNKSLTIPFSLLFSAANLSNIYANIMLLKLDKNRDSFTTILKSLPALVNLIYTTQGSTTRDKSHIAVGSVLSAVSTLIKLNNDKTINFQILKKLSSSFSI